MGPDRRFAASAARHNRVGGLTSQAKWFMHSAASTDMHNLKARGANAFKDARLTCQMEDKRGPACSHRPTSNMITIHTGRTPCSPKARPGNILTAEFLYAVSPLDGSGGALATQMKGGTVWFALHLR